MLPLDARQSYRPNCCSLHRHMEKMPNINLFGNATSQSEVAYNYIKQKVNYIFSNRKLKPDSWDLSYWSVKTLMSETKDMGQFRVVAKLAA